MCAHQLRQIHAPVAQPIFGWLSSADCETRRGLETLVDLSICLQVVDRRNLQRFLGFGGGGGRTSVQAGPDPWRHNFRGKAFGAGVRGAKSSAWKEGIGLLCKNKNVFFFGGGEQAFFWNRWRKHGRVCCTSRRRLATPQRAHNPSLSRTVHIGENL